MLAQANWTPERKLFAAVTERSPFMAWATDIDGVCFYLSPEWYRFTGVKEGEGTGFNWLTMVHPDERVKVRRAFFNANDTQTAYGIAYRLLSADGEYRLVWAAGLPKFNEEHVFEGFFGTVCSIQDFIERDALTAPLAPQPSKFKLSERERQILSLIAEGNTTDTVASMLSITTRTVETHVAASASKLGASNRVHAVAKALRLNEI